MRIKAQSHTYDGTGRAGFTPVEFQTQARTRAGLLKAWSTAAAIEYAHKLKFQREYDTTWCDAQAIDGVWIMEASASIGRDRYRMTAYAERGGAVTSGIYEVSDSWKWHEYAAEADRIAAIKEKYATSASA